MLPMIKTCVLEPEEVEGSWRRRQRTFSSTSDLPPWLARIVGGALVVIREDARWPKTQSRLELYSTNLSHRGLVLVEEWATFEPAATPGRTTKRLVVRVKLVPRALHVISGRLERYLASRYAATLALGERVDAVLRQQILDERAASEWNASTPLATAPPLAEDAVEQQADASPTPPLRPMPPPPPPQEMAPPVPARASLAVRIHEHEKQSKKLLPLVVGFAKWAALGILVRGAGAAVLPKKL